MDILAHNVVAQTQHDHVLGGVQVGAQHAGGHGGEGDGAVAVLNDHGAVVLGGGFGGSGGFGSRGSGFGGSGGGLGLGAAAAGQAGQSQNQSQSQANDFLHGFGSFLQTKCAPFPKKGRTNFRLSRTLRFRQSCVTDSGMYLT